MKSTLPSDYIIPAAAAADYVVVPGLLLENIPAGSYHMTLRGKLRPATTDAPQVFLQPSFGQPNHIAPSASSLHGVIYFDAGGWLDTGIVSNSAAAEVSTYAPSGTGEEPFIITGTLTVPSAGDISAAVFASDFVTGKETTLLAGAELELQPAT